jgi:hypothetical protein
MTQWHNRMMAQWHDGTMICLKVFCFTSQTPCVLFILYFQLGHVNNIFFLAKCLQALFNPLAPEFSFKF